MGIYQVQHAFQGPSGDAEDRYVNVFHIALLEPDDPDVGGANWTTPWHGGPNTLGEIVRTAFTNFYLGFGNGWLGQQVNNPGWSIKAYRLADPQPRAPKLNFMAVGPPFTNTGPLNTNSGLPSEVAVCLSFEAITIAGGNRARRRGRVYIGPLNTDVLDGNPPRVNPGCRGALLDAWVDLNNELAAEDIMIGVYSRTDGFFFAWQTAWVDDAFDTQRRRGEDATTRSTAVLV